MKRFIKSSISIFLILAIVFSFSITTFAEDNAYDPSVQMLQDIGVLPAESFSDDNVITRAEFIKMVTTLIYEDINELGFGDVPFIDVDKESEYYPYISAAYGSNLISGTGGAAFKPNDPIKYIDAVKILTDALGYGIAAVAEGGYINGYAEIASKIKLSKKALALAQTDLTGDLAAELLYDALDVNVADAILSTDGEHKIEVSDETFMDSIGIYHVEGILSENEYTGLYDTEGAGGRSIKIGDVTASIYNTLDDEKYFGYDVNCYYRRVDSKNVVVSLMPSSKNEVTVINAHEFDDYDGDVIKYTLDGSKRQEDINIAKNLYVIYNGRIKDDYAKETFEINEGTITVIDNSGDGKADVINVRSYDNYIVAGLDAENEVIYDCYGKVLDLSVNDTEKSVVIANADGKEIGFSDIAKYQVLSVMADSDFNYIRILVSTKVVSGKITGVSENNGRTIITVEKEKYELSDCISENSLADFELTAEGDFLIDAFGRIAYLKKTDGGPLYSLIIGKYYEKFPDDTYLKFIDVNGAIHESKVSDNCRINGSRVENSVAVYDQLERHDMVIITLNNDNEVAVIETAEGDVLHQINDKAELKYSGGPRWFGKKLTISNTTPIFIYPADESTDENRYMVWNYLYLVEETINIQGFNTNKESYLPDIIAIQEITDSKLFIKYNSTNFVVKRLSSSVDHEGNGIYSLEVSTFGGAERLYKIPVDVLGDKKLNPGDLVKLSTDKSGCVRAIDKFYDAESGSLDAGSKFVAKSTGGFSPMVGYVYEYRNSFLGLSSNAGKGEYNDITYHPTANITNILVVEKNKNSVSISTGTLDMLTDYVTSKNPSKVFTYSQDSIPRALIILK